LGTYAAAAHQFLALRVALRWFGFEKGDAEACLRDDPLASQVEDAEKGTDSPL